MRNTTFTRRRFIEATALAAGAAVLPLSSALGQAKAKYTRYNATSAGGKKALASYAKGVQAMLSLPADNPQNWFRNAFIHLMDCPHGNWWFYLWHRGYVGFFEETIRQLSGDPDFAIPYWDWTALPQIPDDLFNGVLTPTDAAFAPFTGNLARFTAFIQPALSAYWGTLNPAQLAQLKLRGYTAFDLLWNDVTGFNPAQKAGLSANISYAITCGSRYLSRDNPKLDKNTAKNVSLDVILSGLAPKYFYNAKPELRFASSKTDSHNATPGAGTVFSTLEGMPHNLVHNYLGGVGPLDPGPYGSMTNFLSPVDPIFYLHHSNIDRLWDVWTRKQIALKLPYLPKGAELKALSDDPFLFFVDGAGKHILDGKAGDYLSTERFGYAYEPGSGEEVVQPGGPPLTSPPSGPLTGTMKGNMAMVPVPAAAIKTHLAAKREGRLMALITLAHPDTSSGANRQFDVLVGAPEEMQEGGADSPFYAGTIAFFGHMANMEGHAMDATFVVPMPKSQAAFTQALAVANNDAAPAPVSVRLVPSHGRGEKSSALKSVSMHAL